MIRSSFTHWFGVKYNTMDPKECSGQIFKEVRRPIFGMKEGFEMSLVEAIACGFSVEADRTS